MEHVTEKTLHAVDTEIMRLIELGDMNKDVLACLDKLADIKKDTLEAASMESREKEMAQGMSYAGNMGSYGSYNNYRGGQSMGYPYMMDSYNGGSYAQRRDSMGRYSRNSERDQIRANIERQLETAQSDGEREMIHRILSTI